MLLAAPHALQGQPTHPPDLRVTDVRLVDGKTLQVDYQRGDLSGSLDFPSHVLAGLVLGELARNPAGSEESGPGAGEELKQNTPPTGRGRGYAEIYSPETGLTYMADLFADSLVEIWYETGGKEHRVELPANTLLGLHGAYTALAGREGPQTNAEFYYDTEKGTIWFSFFKRLGLGPFMILFGVLVVGLVSAPFAYFIYKGKRERDELAVSRQRLFEAREAERSHLAAELHDGPVQALQQVIREDLLLLSKVIDEDKPHEHLNVMKETLQRVTSDLRNISTELRPPVLVHFGLSEALHSYVDQYRTRYPDLEIELDAAPEKSMLPLPVRLALYRIAQEALTNVARHAQARRVWVAFRLEAEEIRLTIRDDGRGFTPPKRWIELERAGHLGLSGIAARVGSIGGHLEVASAPGQGTKLGVVAPRPTAVYDASGA